MRKNGVNRKLQEISGGVCAPKGFRASGVHCGISCDPSKKDLALIVAERRCPTAALFSESCAQSAPTQISKKHLKNGLARAIVINSGVANVFLPNGEWLTEKICRILASCSDIDMNDTLIASTGKVGAPLSLTPFEKGIPELVKELSDFQEGSFSAAEGIMTTDKRVKQLAFQFDLGDFPCKIGAIFKGTTQVCPNMATMLAFFTTDVNISSEMLQKALSSVGKDTFNMIDVDGVSSPNDAVFLMANGKAGNYKISKEDTEYAKFVYALRETMTEVCKRIVKDGEHRMLVCKVQGARSKQIARMIAKKIVCVQTAKTMPFKDFQIANILYEINSVAEDVDFSKARVTISTKEKTFVVFDEGRSLQLKEETVNLLNKEEDLALTIDLGTGNYTATSFGRLE